MSQKPRVLIVDDEPDVVANWREVLDQEGYPCVTAIDGAHGLKLLESEHPDLVLTDLWMPQIDGMTILSRAVELDPDTVVIMITGHGTVQSAVEAMRAGAFDYLLKPLPSNDTLRLAVRRGADRRRLLEENRRLREPLASRVGFETLVGTSAKMVAVLDLVQKAARSESNILIQGESGTGKELIARAIHANSPRASEVFVPLDCAALQDTLLESELFGHERGAFTGADRMKPGMIEVADRGTLFLDEIGELPMALQAKLLRALQERQIRRVGGTKFVDVDMRLVSATNRDAAELVRKSEFREDLFYRINVITISLPPLRERSGRRPGARLPLPASPWPEPRASAGGDRSRCRGPARGVPVAGQCPGTPERHRARVCPRRRAHRAPARPPRAHPRARPAGADRGSRRPDLPRRPGELAPGVRPGVPHRSVAAPRRERLAGRKGGGPGPEDPPRPPGQVRSQRLGNPPAGSDRRSAARRRVGE